MLLLTMTLLIPSHQSLGADVYDPTPNDQETSVFAVGNCAVSAILIEYIGGHDGKPKGNWTASMEEEIQLLVEESLDKFEELSPNECLRFLPPEFYFRVPVTYDPMSSNRTDDNLWVSEAMSYLGFEGTDCYSQARDFVNDLRHRSKSDWAVAVFFCDGTYSNGRFPFEDKPTAYAHLGGPYLAYAYPAQSRLMFIHELSLASGPRMSTVVTQNVLDISILPTTNRPSV